MKTTTTTTDIAAADPIYIALQGHAAVDSHGCPFAFKEGARIRESTGIPRRFPTLWVREDSDDLERARARNSL